MADGRDGCNIAETANRTNWQGNRQERDLIRLMYACSQSIINLMPSKCSIFGQVIADCDKIRSRQTPCRVLIEYCKASRTEPNSIPDLRQGRNGPRRRRRYRFEPQIIQHCRSRSPSLRLQSSLSGAPIRNLFYML